MKTVLFGPEAIAELESAIQVYEEQRPGRGENFREAVEAAIDLISRYPRIGSKYFGSHRKRNVQDFPYLIFYVEYPDYLWVSAVYHGHRQPDAWIDRERPNEN